MKRSTTSLVVALCGLLSTASAPAARAGGFEAADVFRSASPSVVLVFAHRGRSTGNSGTGTIVDASGLVLTNAHVIRDPNTDAPYRAIRVYLKPDQITGDRGRDLSRGHWAHLVAEDRQLDLALLRIQGSPGPLSVMSFGNSEQVEVGQSVAAIGHPSGGGLWTLTTGAISSVRRDGKRDVFQTDTAINPGNSGGPLLDAGGHMIGINTFIRRRDAKNLPLEGLNYALRSSTVAAWVGRQGFRVSKAAPGVQVAKATPARPAPQAAAPAPMSPPKSTTVIGAAPASPGSGPSPAAASLPPRSAQPKPRQPRAFRGAGGEAMFGVPDPSLDLEELRKLSYQRARRNAADAFEELESGEDDDFDF